MRSRAPWILAVAVVAGLAVPGAALVAGADDPVAPPSLPELPSVADQVEGLYDDDGCLQTGPAEVDCSVRAADVDAALSDGGAGETRHLEGFVGSRWLTRVDGGGPTVLPASVERSAIGSFVASGLARNESAAVLATLEVTARLLDAEGAELAEVTAVSPVHDIRPGEPVPFTVRADIDASAVARVVWTAAGGAAGDTTHRALSWTPFWERPAGGEPVDLYLYRDGAGPRPHLVFGSVASVGDAPAGGPEVVVGWLSPEGRLVGVVTSPVRGPDGAPLASLAAGGAADALVQAEGAPPIGAEMLVWVQGS